jgi:hypothetical protein
MSGRTMDQRVGDLEKLAHTLALLPREVAQLGNRVAGVESHLDSVESQIVQLRTEMFGGFSAIRGQMADMKTELREDISSLGREAAAGFIRVGEEMRVLFEERFGRLEVIAEGNPSPDAPPGPQRT